MKGKFEHTEHKKRLRYVCAQSQQHKHTARSHLQPSRAASEETKCALHSSLASCLQDNEKINFRHLDHTYQGVLLCQPKLTNIEHGIHGNLRHRWGCSQRFSGGLYHRIKIKTVMMRCNHTKPLSSGRTGSDYGTIWPRPYPLRNKVLNCWGRNLYKATAAG